MALWIIIGGVACISRGLEGGFIVMSPTFLDMGFVLISIITIKI